MAIGASYFGNRILRHVASDMEDLARRGFTGVLHTFSENDLNWYRGQMARIVEVSHDVGLEVQVGPWGLAHVFGGEAESLFMTQHPDVGQRFADGRTVGAGCPSRPELRAFVKRWAQAAVELGADRIFWDEPHWAHPVRFDQPRDAWTCICAACQEGFRERFGHDMPAELTDEVRAYREDTLVDFVRDVVGHVASIGGRSTVCLLPSVDGLHAIDDWDGVASIPGLDTLATDPYWSFFGQDVDAFVGGLSERTVELARRHGLTPQIWIQGFMLRPEQADEIAAAVAAARAAGVEDLWTWGYEACGHMSHLETERPELVWEALSHALTGGQPAPGPAGGVASAAGDVREGDHSDLDVLATERRLPDAEQLDQLTTREQVALFAREDANAVAAVDAAGDAIAAAVDLAVAQLRRGGRLIEVGAGTPGRLAFLDVAECGPTFGVERDRIVAVVAGGSDAVVAAAEEGEDDADAGRADLLALDLTPADVVIGISASGRTPYVLAALGTAREAGAATIAVSSNEGSPLAAEADLAIETLTGAEVVNGSTRLKAGTAQKLVLNAISTLTMVQLGHAYGDLMVDVRATNDKLRRRAHRVVVQATGEDDDVVAAALTAADGHAKLAIVSLLAGVDVDTARARLRAADGRAREAIAGVSEAGG